MSKRILSALPPIANNPDTDLAELQKRLTMIKIGLLVIITLLGLRLWQVQIRDGHYYQALAWDNRTRSIILRPARGLIYDRNGQLLANNVPSFNLYLSMEDIKDRQKIIDQLIHYLDLDREALETTLSHTRHSSLVKAKRGLTLKEAALIESHRLDLPGVIIQPEYQRNYPLGRHVAHVIGYVGEISDTQLQQKADPSLQPGSMIGQYGIERTYDQYLRGQPGRELIEVDALGHKKQPLSTQRPQAGNDLYVTLDIRLQRLAEELLGKDSGAIVALAPHTGEILAMASQPEFNPNALSNGLTPTQWQTLLHDSRHPLTNRAIQGQYPPGSTFKIVMAAAALGSHTLDVSDPITCRGGFHFGRRTYRDWKAGGHGVIRLIKALAQSCDVYFYKAGNRMGIKTIAEYAHQFGLGKRTGIDLPSERPGLVPSPEWKLRVKGEPWYPGETISVSIGQGYLTVTPLQMAMVVAFVANNGQRIHPHFIRAIRDRTTGHIKDWTVAPPTQMMVSTAILSHVREGMAAVVREGTARRIRSSLVSIAGKTGTAQVVALRSGAGKHIPKKFRDHAWFVAFAPIEAPRIAVAVIVEHKGHGGSAAAPLAKELIETFIQLDSRNPVFSTIPSD